MPNSLFIGFKGKNNSSGILANSFSPQSYLLTNSFEGLKKDIEKIPSGYEKAYLFGVDKNLQDSLRIERFAETGGVLRASVLDLEGLAKQFPLYGINADLSAATTKYLCNAAYGHLIEKFNGNAVLIHIPTIKHFDQAWISDIKQILY